jgi:alpha-ketoglutarate-dependent taurine dioxygenase
MIIDQLAECPLPVVIRPDQPTGSGRSKAALIEYLSGERPDWEPRLLERGGILLRGFDVKTAEDFETVAHTICPELGQYIRGVVPRSPIRGRIYTSADVPRFLTIPLHGELAYSDRYPSGILFHCETAAPVGGQTPLADLRRVYRRIDPMVRDRFVQRGLLVINNAPARGGRAGRRTWSELFQSPDSDIVEERCRQQGIEFEWKQGDTLCLRKHRPAVVEHPVTGELTWFNSVHTSHYSWSSALRRGGLWFLAALLSCRERFDRRFRSSDDFPNHCLYGDGAEIPLSDVEHVRDVFDAETMKFDWQPGDVLLLDNLLTAHGRRAYRGPRRINIALIPQQPRDLEGRTTEHQRQGVPSPVTAMGAD